MAKTNTLPKFKGNFLDEYVVQILKQHGFDNLNAEAQKEYLPQFTAEAERRIGERLMPLLSEKTGNEFVDLFEKNDATAEEWRDFWTKSIPDFAEIVKDVLEKFAGEVKQAFMK